jgi:hypothetical protein
LWQDFTMSDVPTEPDPEPEGENDPEPQPQLTLKTAGGLWNYWG